jgi:hypothetical protein
MTVQQPIADAITETATLMRAKLGTGGATFAAQVRRAGHRMPRRLRAQARALALAEPLAGHPKLSRTLDAAALCANAAELRDWLQSIDLADRRRGWWLGMLGGLAFNLLAFAALVLVVLRWRGFL